MSKNGRSQASLEEKQRLLALYYESTDTIESFCLKHGIAQSSFYRWKKKFDSMPGVAARPGRSIEEELRAEVLKLRIENERLKKNYMVKKTADGKTEFVRLKTRNMK